MDWSTRKPAREGTVSRSKRSDGGIDTDRDGSPFHTTADIETTRSERYRALLDEYIVAPCRIIWEDIRVRVGFAIVLFYVLVGTLGVVFVAPPATGQGPIGIGAFQSLDYPLGTDGLGKNLLSVTVHATTPVLKMITAGAVFSTGIATIWGTFAGYKGGRFDRILMSISDIVMTIPGLPLTIILAAIVQPESPFVIGIILTINVWAGFSRKLRSQVMTIRGDAYVEASRTMGLSTPRIVLKDVLPNVMPYITVNFVTSARRVIISSVALYFLGVLPRSAANWGTTLQNAFNNGALYDMSMIHWFLVPLVSIVLLSLGLILLGQGLDRVFNPRIRARHAKSVGDGEPAD